ncbi:hypothetical protein [Mariniluteicoccus endophyticus]
MWLDLLGAALGATVLLPVPRETESVRALLTAVASVEAMLVALVTFSLTFMAQSTSPELAKTRRKHGKQLARAWQWCIGVVLLSTVVALVGVWLAKPFPAWSCGIGLGAFGVSLASTLRALDFFAYTVQTEGSG